MPAQILGHYFPFFHIVQIVFSCDAQILGHIKISYWIRVAQWLQ